MPAVLLVGSTGLWAVHDLRAAVASLEVSLEERGDRWRSNASTTGTCGVDAEGA